MSREAFGRPIPPSLRLVGDHGRVSRIRCTDELPECSLGVNESAQQASGATEPAASVVVVIPALNEERTVASVVAVARSLPEVCRVVVIDNGSRDSTAEVARNMGAIVLDCQETGKAQAVRRGLIEANRSAVAAQATVLLLDADLHGLTAAHLQALLAPLRSDEVDMVCGVLSNSTIRGWLLRLPLPSLTGQRAIRFNRLQSVDLSNCNGYELEAAINCAIGLHRTRRVALRGVSHVRRERKTLHDWASASSVPRRLAGPWMRFCVLLTYARLLLSSSLATEWRREP